MRPLGGKSDQSTAPVQRPEKPKGPQRLEPLDGLQREFLIMGKYPITPDRLDVVDRSAKPNCTRDIRRPCFETMRRRLKRASFVRDVHDHLAPAMPGRRGFENLRTPIERSTPRR